LIHGIRGFLYEWGNNRRNYFGLSTVGITL
jgi:hypothetical protein